MHALGLFVAAALLVLLAIAISIRVELLGHLHADAASAPTTPVALILGAEVYADGRPSPALANRLDVGIELLRLGRVRALLMSGGNGTFDVGAMARMRSRAASGRSRAVFRRATRSPRGGSPS
jgi:vancomycin permeability regulator SanA